MLWQEAKKMVIRWCKVRRLWRMLKDFQFALLEYGFDDKCKVGPGVVVELCKALRWPWHSFQVLRALSSELRFNSRLWRISWSHPNPSLLNIYVKAQFLITRDDFVQKGLFMSSCCSMAEEMLRSVSKAIFFVFSLVVCSWGIRAPNFSANPIE